MGFSSTIIGLKLLPTTVLHHQRMGEVIISVLLLQDLLAIALLLVVKGPGEASTPWLDMLILLLSLPGLVLFAGITARMVLIPLIARYDTIREYIFLMAIGWCLGLAELAALLGLSHEMGAFIAGVALATSPIALFIAERLRPLRDFFLVLFFFGVGVQFDLTMGSAVLFPALALAIVAVVLKPIVFRLLLVPAGETRTRAWEIGFRLGQMSEFSLLIAAAGLATGLLGERAAYTLQLATVITFIVSSYVIVMRFPTPIALSDALRRD
jgi:Kef-type K+ transport system membrane component KefB